MYANHRAARVALPWFNMLGPNFGYFYYLESFWFVSSPSGDVILLYISFDLSIVVVGFGNCFLGFNVSASAMDYIANWVVCP